MKESNLKLTVDEANLILEALGNLPFNKVFNLIGKIQNQAASQLNGQGSEQDAASENVALDNG